MNRNGTSIIVLDNSPQNTIHLAVNRIDLRTENLQKFDTKNCVQKIDTDIVIERLLIRGASALCVQALQAGYFCNT
jgi:hypothetical protein